MKSECKKGVNTYTRGHKTKGIGYFDIPLNTLVYPVESISTNLTFRFLL